MSTEVPASRTEVGPADRVLRIFDAYVARGSAAPNKSALKAWMGVFHIEHGAHEEDQTVSLLQALRAEIDLARQSAKSRGVGDELLDPGLSNFRQAASVGLLTNPWQTFGGNLTPPNVRLSIAWTAWALRDVSEFEVRAEDMAALEALLADLEKLLSEADIQPFVREFTTRQVEGIRSALRAYPVSGGKAIKAAMRSVVGDFATSGQELAAAAKDSSAASKGVLAKGVAIVEKAAKICDSFSKVTKAGKEAGEIAGQVGPYLLPLIALVAGK
jgi:hypothetical protein